MTSDSTTYTAGIIVNARTGVTIRNGNIRSGQFGINASAAHGLVVEKVDFMCRNIGLSINADTVGAVVRDCTFHDIEGWTVNGYAIGLNGVGDDTVVEDCVFRNIYKQPTGGSGEGCAILVSGGAVGSIIRNNWIENDNVTLTDLNIGVWVSGASEVSENVITNFGRGIIAAGNVIATDNRLFMRGPEPSSKGIHAMAGAVEKNVIVGFEIAMSGDAPRSDNYVVGGGAPLVAVVASDSNGTNHYDPSEPSWPDLVATGLGCVMHNMSHVGYYAAGVLTNLSAYLAVNPGLFILNVGTNDMANAADDPYMTFLGVVDDLVETVEGIIDGVVPTCPIWVVSIPATKDAAENGRILVANAAIKRLCDRKGVLFIDTAGPMLEDLVPLRWFQQSVDKYHLSPLGKTLYASTILRTQAPSPME